MLDSLSRGRQVVPALLVVVLGCANVVRAAPKPVAAESSAEASPTDAAGANTAAKNTRKRARSAKRSRYLYTAETNAPHALGDGELLRSALTLSLLVLAFGGATALVLRLVLRKRHAGAPGGRGLRKLATLPLTRKDALHVVRLGEQLFVLATGAGTPALVSRLEAERADRVEAELQGGGFAGWLRAAATAARPDRAPAPANFSQVRAAQVRDPFGAPVR